MSRVHNTLDIPKEGTDTRVPITLWFGKEISVQDAKRKVRALQQMGLFVFTPFYIGYSVSDDLLIKYLRSSISASCLFCVLGTEGNILCEAKEYAERLHKQVIQGEDFSIEAICREVERYSK